MCRRVIPARLSSAPAVSTSATPVAWRRWSLRAAEARVSFDGVTREDSSADGRRRRAALRPWASYHRFALAPDHVGAAAERPFGARPDRRGAMARRASVPVRRPGSRPHRSARPQSRGVRRTGRAAQSPVVPDLHGSTIVRSTSAGGSRSTEPARSSVSTVPAERSARLREPPGRIRLTPFGPRAYFAAAREFHTGEMR